MRPAPTTCAELEVLGALKFSCCDVAPALFGACASAVALNDRDVFD